MNKQGHQHNQRGWAETFDSMSVVLPVINETDALRETVAVLRRDCDRDIREFLIVTCRRTTSESRAVAAEIQKECGDRAVVFDQSLPYLGGACRDAFARAQESSHVLMMASDLETPPERARFFVEEARRTPGAIVTGSRWLEGGGFEGYAPAKFLMNYLFQRFFSALYRTRLTDLTYGYRLFPRSLVQAIRWEELRHAFLFETLVKPLRLGVPVREIAVTWKARKEGGSQNTFLQNFVYFRIGLRTLFYPPSRILKEPLE